MEEITTEYECPFCKKKFESFISLYEGFGESAEIKDSPEISDTSMDLCPYCFSMNQERMYRLFIEEETELMKKWHRVLHIGDEPYLRNWLISTPTVRYDGQKDVSKDLTKLNYPDKTFHLIICSYALNHVRDEQEFLKELHRVLKNDGKAIIQVPIKEDDDTIYSNEKIYKKKNFMEMLKKFNFFVQPIILAEVFEGKALQSTFRYGLSTNTLFVVNKIETILETFHDIKPNSLSAENTSVPSNPSKSGQSVFSNRINNLFRKLIGE